MFCRFCGKEMQQGARYCPHCGMDQLSTADVSSAPEAPAGADYVPPPDMEPVLFPERNIVAWVIISIITCGIGALVWWGAMASDIKSMRTDGKPTFALDLILTIVCCGIYFYYVSYQYPKWIYEAEQERGIPSSDLSVPSIVLNFFGLGIVALALWQAELNKIAERSGAAPGL